LREVTLPAEPLIRVILDPDDLPGTRDRLQALHRPQLGVVVSPVTPSARHLHWLARDLLNALGKRDDVRGAPRNAQRAMDRATVWMAAYHTSDIVISRAHLLSRPYLGRLFEMACALDARLWLVAQTGALRRGFKATLQDWGARTASLEELESAIAQTGASNPADPAPAPALSSFPAVPSDEFVTFRTACRDLLSPDEFAVADSAFLHGHQAAAAAASVVSDDDGTEEEQEDARRRRGGDDDEEEEEEEQAAAMLSVARALTDSAGSTDEAICRLRGWQAAALPNGWHGRLKLDAFRACRAAQTGQLSPDVISNYLRVYPSPQLACAAALSAGGLCSTTKMLRLQVSDISTDGLQIAGRQVRAPLDAILRAHRLMRLANGALPDDPLFVRSESERSPWTAHALKLALRRIGRESGLGSLSHGIDLINLSDRRWAARAGVSLTRLESA